MSELMMKPRQSSLIAAAAEYQRHRRAIARLLQDIDDALAVHEAARAANPTHWSYANELGHVEVSLQEIVDLLANEE